MNAEEWFRAELQALQDDPDYLTEGVLLDVTEQIYARMQEHGLRQTDLAECLGVSRAFVSQLLNGKPNMTMRTLVGVAHALGQRVEIRLRPAVKSGRNARARGHGRQQSPESGTPTQRAPRARRAASGTT